MLDFREQLSRMKEQKQGNIKYNVEDIFNIVLIPYFENFPLEQLENGIEIFVHYHSDYFLIGSRGKTILYLSSDGIGYSHDLVEQMEKYFRDAKFRIPEKFPDGFSVIIKA